MLFIYENGSAGSQTGARGNLVRSPALGLLTPEDVPPSNLDFPVVFNLDCLSNRTSLVARPTCYKQLHSPVESCWQGAPGDLRVMDTLFGRSF